MAFRYWLLALLGLTILSLPSWARNASRPVPGPTPTQQVPAWVTGTYRVNYYRPPQLVRQNHRKPGRRSPDVKKNRRMWPGD